MPPAADDAAIDTHSNHALTSLKRNLRYLYNPTTSSTPPPRRLTRATLRVLRSALTFAFWRLVRYAKYVAIGSLVATVSAGAFGTLVSGAGFVLAPTGIAGTIVAASIWGVGKFAVRRLGKRWERGYQEGRMHGDWNEGRSGVNNRGGLGYGPGAVPW